MNGVTAASLRQSAFSFAALAMVSIPLAIGIVGAAEFASGAGLYL